MRLISLFLFILFGISTTFSQNYDVRFNRTSINCVDKRVCYDVQIRPSSGSIFNLAGQNYRIFYNSALAGYESGSSYLPVAYGNYTLVQDIQDVNADAVNGLLNFEATLGFLNFSMDLNDIQNGGINLPTNGNWFSTANLCFIVEDEVLNSPDNCLEFVWGRNGVTQQYGTAFVEVSRWLSANNTTNGIGTLFDDLDASDGNKSCLENECSAVELSIEDKSVFENIGVANVQVCLNIVDAVNTSFTVNSLNGTATSDLDFTSIINQVYTIPAGQACVTIPLTILDDDIYEGTENLQLIITSPSSNATISDGNGTVTIFDNEGPCNASAPLISGN